MIEIGICKAKERKNRRVYKRRVLMARFGELLQGDGSRHAWFEDLGKECAIVIFVDDPTSTLTKGKFASVKITCSYQEIL